MEIPLYLAMTAAEFRNCSKVPQYFGWMACHFSPYGTGLSNLPDALPPESLIILNDRTPIHSHDPEQITQQLIELIQNHRPTGILLDFQRPGCAQTKDLTKHLVQALPCPVCVSEFYARNLDCPVLLHPVPLNIPIGQYLQPWQGRAVWLEAALDGIHLQVTEKGCQEAVYTSETDEVFPHHDQPLCCHYRIRDGKDKLDFYLKRNQEDLHMLLEAAKLLGVDRAVGLWQELGM